MARVVLRWEALEPILRVYEESSPPVEHYLEPNGDSSLDGADLLRMLKAVAPAWRNRNLPDWPIREAIDALAPTESTTPGDPPR